MIITHAYIIGYKGLATSYIFLDYYVTTIILQKVVAKSKLLEQLLPYQNDSCIHHVNIIILRSYLILLYRG